jgi:hypothetical protein
VQSNCTEAGKVSVLDLHHAATVLVVLIACTVMLWLILRDAKVIKVNVNANSNPVQSIFNDSIDVGTNKLLFSVIWRGTQGIPLNWDVALLNAVVGRIQPPATAEPLGRKVTVVVYGRNNEVERSIVGIENLPLRKCDDTPNNGRRFAKIKVMLLLSDSEQQMAAALRDVHAEKRNEGGHAATN